MRLNQLKDLGIGIILGFLLVYVIPNNTWQMGICAASYFTVVSLTVLEVFFDNNEAKMTKCIMWKDGKCNSDYSRGLKCNGNSRYVPKGCTYNIDLKKGEDE